MDSFSCIGILLQTKPKKRKRKKKGKKKNLKQEIHGVNKIMKKLKSNGSEGVSEANAAEDAAGLRHASVHKNVKFCGWALPISLSDQTLGLAGGFQHQSSCSVYLSRRQIARSSTSPLRQTQRAWSASWLTVEEQGCLKRASGEFFIFLFLNKTVMSALEQGT